MKEPVTEFGKEIRKLRMSRNLTQKEFARMWKVHRACLTTYETTTMLPRRPVLQRLREAFNVDPYVWIERERKKRSQPQKAGVIELPRGKSAVTQNTKSHVQGEQHERAG